MILESSKDYGTGTILIMFSDKTPSLGLIKKHIRQNYGRDLIENIEIDEPTVCKGFKNLGSIRVTTQ